MCLVMLNKVLQACPQLWVCDAGSGSVLVLQVVQ